MHLNSCELYDCVCICQVIIYDDNNNIAKTELSVVSAFNAVQHVMVQHIRRSDGTVATDTNDVLDVWGEFYFCMFSSQDLSEGIQGHFLDPIERRLTPGESGLCEGDLTIEECSKLSRTCHQLNRPGKTVSLLNFFGSFGERWV